MPRISGFYNSPIRLQPINRKAIGAFLKSTAKLVEEENEKPAENRRKHRETILPLPADGLVPLDRAARHDFIPHAAMVRGVSVRLPVPSWHEAFVHIVEKLKIQKRDDLRWIEPMYLTEDENGYDPKSSCLFKLRHLTKILGYKRDDIVFVARQHIDERK